ncbi:MAG: hypothetical protein HC902_01435 [Calothrix sp. SM1_5_4]|nr:hypothetical protein [Calothrix sp. SM1_5_4]
MREIALSFLILCSTIVASPSVASDWSDEFWEEMSSPLSAPAAYYLGGGTALTLAFVASAEDTSYPLQERTAREKPLGDYAVIGDLAGQLIPNALYVLGMEAGYRYGGAAADPRLRELSRLMFKATAYSVAVTTLLKYTIREPRPDNSRERNSFPSGHGTSIFAFAGVVAQEHEWYWGAGAYALAPSQDTVVSTTTAIIYMTLLPEQRSVCRTPWALPRERRVRSGRIRTSQFSCSPRR